MVRGSGLLRLEARVMITMHIGVTTVVSLASVLILSVGNFHNQSSVWPNQSIIDCKRFMGRHFDKFSHMDVGMRE